MSEIQALEMQLYELTNKLNELRRQQMESSNEVGNYSFATLDGETTLADMFGDPINVLHDLDRVFKDISVDFLMDIPDLVASLSIGGCIRLIDVTYFTRFCM